MSIVYTACRVQRRIVVARTTFDAATGKWNESVHTAELHDPCGKLLVDSDDDVVAGVCRTCLCGWQTEANHPTSEGAALIAQAVKRREGQSR